MSGQYIDPKCVTSLPYAETDLRQKVFTALGEASTCWESLEGAGVFESTRAAEIGEGLVADIIRVTCLGQPSLGLATTRELAEELACRVRLNNAHPDYRTVNE